MWVGAMPMQSDIGNEAAIAASLHLVCRQPGAITRPMRIEPDALCIHTPLGY